MVFEQQALWKINGPGIIWINKQLIECYSRGFFLMFKRFKHLIFYGLSCVATYY